jgi:cytoskeleton protein RodZ
MKKGGSMIEDEAVQHGLSDTGALGSGNCLNHGAAGQSTAGALLRQSRQSQGLEIDALAAWLKVPVQKLQALEQDRFDQLPDPVFTRALAASMCRLLKLDPAPVLQLLPAIASFNVISQDRGINTPFRARNIGHGASVWSHISRSAVLVGLALLLAALVLIFLPVIQQEIARYQQEGQDSAAKSELVEPVFIAAPETIPVAADSGAPEIASNPPAEPLPPAEIPALVSTSATSTRAENAAATNPTIAFSATGESWIKVTDAKGAVPLNRTLRAGESAGASGVLPLVAVVGRADAIEVQVHGQAFSLDGVTRNNIARFEVK